MTTFPRAESRRKYSWWWDSHISPKNSKWLQENLTDMDLKVKTMIKLIEEDADSFARRAEMYYKKRPELMKLVEEFYRAYRALAERYDHATGALRHAHRTMSEAFPNHIPFALPDESISNSTSEMPSPGAFSASTPFNAFDSNGQYEDSEILAPKKGLKNFNETSLHREGAPRAKLPERNELKVSNAHEEDVTPRARLPEWKIRKSLNFDEEEEISPHAKVNIDSKRNLSSQPKENEGVKYGVKHLQELVLQLSSENQNLKIQIELESKHLDISRAEVQSLREEMPKLEAEKDAALHQQQLSNENISKLENEISEVKIKIRELIEEMEIAVLKLSGAEQQCIALEKANQRLQLELDEAKIKLEELKHSLNRSEDKFMEAEMSFQSSEQLYSQSNEEVMLMAFEIQSLVEILREVGRSKVGLKEEIFLLKDMNFNLNEHSLSCAVKMKHLENEMVFLKEKNVKLENEIEIQEEDKRIFQQELETIKESKNHMYMKHQCLLKEMEAASVHLESLATQTKDLQFRHDELKEGCSKLEDEKLLFLSKLRGMESLYERNLVLENSLTDANMELGEFRKNFSVLEGACDSLNAVVSSHTSEKNALALQIEIFVGNVKKLSEKNTLLENSLDDANTEIEELRLKLRDLEELYQSMSHTNSDLMEEKNNIISQVEVIQQRLANLEVTHGILEVNYLTLDKEKDASVKKILVLEHSLIAIQKEHESLIHSQKVSFENQLHILQGDKQLMEEELESERLRSLSHKTELFILNNFLIDLSNSLMIEKQMRMSFVQSSEIQLADFKNQIHLLQDEMKVRDYKIEEEEQKSMNSMFSILILQNILSEMQGQNLTLVQQCQKHLEASKFSEELTKKLEDRELVQKENITLLVEHISKVRDSIEPMLKPLSKELMNNQRKEEVILPIVLSEINDLLSSISEFHDKNQLLCLEISVYQILLKQTELEKVHLSLELEKTENQSLVLHREHNQLIEEYEQCHHDAIATDFTSIAIKSELKTVTTKLLDSFEKLYELREEINALNEENCLMCVEAMTLEHLYMFFKNLNVENMKQLNLLSGDMCSLLSAKNDLDEEIRGSQAREKSVDDENKQLKESPILLEELKSLAVVSEFDLHSVRSFCEELILQVKTENALLKEKSLDLLKVNNILQYKQEEVTELCRKVEISNKEADEAKFMKSESENKVVALLEGIASKDSQIVIFNEENRILNEELNRAKDEIKTLKMMDQHLSNELQEERKVVAQCEEKIVKLYSEVQASAINATMLDEKMLDLASRCEGLEISAMLLSETLKEEIILKIAHDDELKKKVDDYENENGRLKKNLEVLYPLFSSLGNAISGAKEQVGQEIVGNQEKSPYHHENHETITGNLDIATMPGVLELQNLIAEAAALQKLVAGIKGNHYQEMILSAAKLESARKEIEDLKLKESSFMVEKQTKESANMVKDIELDQISSSFGAAAVNYGNLPSADQYIEAADEAKRQNPSSELSTDRDVSAYRKGISREIRESQEEWNSWVFKRLTSVAEKLAALQASGQELKLKMTKYNAGASQNKLQFDTIRAKLKQAEEAISGQVEKNHKLTVMVGLYSNNAEEMGRAERSQVVEQVRSASDKIGMLELELQKIDYIFLKFEEDWESYSTGGNDRTPRVLLKDYLYGRKNRHGRKKRYFCGCMRPRTTDDY